MYRFTRLKNNKLPPICINSNSTGIGINKVVGYTIHLSVLVSMRTAVAVKEDTWKNNTVEPDNVLMMDFLQ